MAKNSKASKTTGKGSPASRRNSFKNNRKFIQKKNERAAEAETKQQKPEEASQSSNELKSTPFNDISWYSANPSLLGAAASIPFPYRPGMTLSMASKYTSSTKQTRQFVTPIPGVLALDWQPTIGNAATANDAPSIAAKEIYSRVREVYSGSLEADPPDFVIYLLALDSIFCYIASLKRIYRILTTYSANNYVLPDCLLKALGLTSAAIENFKVQKMSLFQVITELIGMTQKFRCPAVFPLFNRHYWLNDNVYTDDASINSQFYVFHQAAYYKFGSVNTPQGQPAGGLTLVSEPSYGANAVSQAYEFGKSLIEALATSDDAYTISGYLMRAYEGAPMFAVDPLPLTAEFLPLFIPEVLMQIENTVAIDSDPLLTLSVSQDPTKNIVLNSMVFTATFDSTAPYLTPSLSIRSDAPTPADVVEATRLQTGRVVQSVDATASTITYKLLAGTEIPLRWNLWYLNQNGTITTSQVAQLTKINPTVVADWMGYLDNMSLVSNFDWHPKFTCTYYNSTSTVDHFAAFFDLHNTTQFSVDQLEQIHKICLYSEFNSFAV